MNAVYVGGIIAGLFLLYKSYNDRSIPISYRWKQLAKESVIIFIATVAVVYFANNGLVANGDVSGALPLALGLSAVSNVMSQEGGGGSDPAPAPAQDVPLVDMTPQQPIQMHIEETSQPIQKKKPRRRHSHANLKVGGFESDF